MIYGRSHDLASFVAYLPTPDDPRARIKLTIGYNEAMNLLGQLERFRDEVAQRAAQEERQDG